MMNDECQVLHCLNRRQGTILGWQLSSKFGFPYRSSQWFTHINCLADLLSIKHIPVFCWYRYTFQVFVGKVYLLIPCGQPLPSKFSQDVFLDLSQFGLAFSEAVAKCGTPTVGSDPLDRFVGGIIYGPLQDGQALLVINGVVTPINDLING